MAAVNLTFMGQFYDKVSRVYYENATMVGVAFLSDLHVGGGPILPPQQPPIMWPPPHPSHPIPPIPAHPIVLPPDPPPVDPPTEPPTNPADPQWEWAWNPNTGWIPAFVPGDKPRPPGTA